MLGFYYLFVFIIVGIMGSSSILLNSDEFGLDNPIKYILMYQYAVYEMVKDKINIVGIILLETFVTFSVWFLNIIIASIIIIFYILYVICLLFLLIFKKH